jgi:hypothetical protein
MTLSWSDNLALIIPGEIVYLQQPRCFLQGFEGEFLAPMFLVST